MNESYEKYFIGSTSVAMVIASNRISKRRQEALANSYKALDKQYIEYLMSVYKNCHWWQFIKKYKLKKKIDERKEESLQEEES